MTKWYFICVMFMTSLCCMEEELPAIMMASDGDQENVAPSAPRSGIDESTRDEGWRLRERLTLFFDARYNSLDPADFTEVHRDMAKIERAVSQSGWERLRTQGGVRNIALVRYSLIGEEQSDQLGSAGNVVYLKGREFELGGDLERQEHVVVASGKWAPRGEKMPQRSDGPAAQQQCYKVITAKEVELTELQMRLQRWLCDDSRLHNTSFHQRLKGDLKKIGRLKNEMSQAAQFAMSSITSETLNGQRAGFKDLEDSYLDSEQTVIDRLANPIVQDEFRKNVVLEARKNRLRTVLGVVVHLHTRLNPCEICGPALFRECERPDGLMHSLQSLIAREQGDEYPFGILLVSCREYHRRQHAGDTFSGVDRPYMVNRRHNVAAEGQRERGERQQPWIDFNQSPVNVDSMPPFYPLVPLEEATREELVRLAGDRYLCDDPQTLNRRAVIRFCRQHGGLEAWRHIMKGASPSCIGDIF